jgi:hypothetical protein
VSGRTFELASPNFRLSSYWVPRAKAAVESAPGGATVTLRLRYIQANQVFVLIALALGAIGMITGGAILVSTGTSGGALAIAVGLVILAALGVLVQQMARVARVMADALSAELDDII